MKRERRMFVCMAAYTDYVYDARVRREAETLAAHGFHVRCLCLTGASAMPRFAIEGVEVRQLPIRRYRGKSTVAYLLSYLRFLCLTAVACLQMLAKRELDVLHVHNIPDFLVLAGLVPRAAGTKVILDVHDSVPETFATKFAPGIVGRTLLFLEERWSAHLADRVICVNHPQRDTLVGRGIPRAKTFVSMNVPDPRLFTPAAPRDLTRQTDRLNLVYHGTMAQRLGVDLVLRAVAQLQPRIPGVKVHLWGHGDDLPAFQRLATELKIRQNVAFEPNGFALQDLPAHLRDMDVGVVGNRRTAAGDLMLPVKLLEYIALGIPVVAPRLKAIGHYFSDDMIAFYEPEDVGSMAACILRLYCEPEVRARLATHARAFLVEHGWERQGLEFVRFYRSVVEK